MHDALRARGGVAHHPWRDRNFSRDGSPEPRNRPPSQRALRHAWLTEQIRAVHLASRGTFGSRRVHAELRLGRGLVVGYHAVEMLMRRAGIRGLPGSRRPRPKHQTPTASDLVNRDVTRSSPNQLWVTDITEHPTREGKVYCAVVLDTFSRRVVGWSIDATQTATLVTNALSMAISSRQPSGTVIHSDHGVQFTSWAFTRRVQEAGLAPSMGSIGDCYDNGMIESFWGRMQTELLNRRTWRRSGPFTTGPDDVRDICSPAGPTRVNRC
ncbi:IS3 family transposase [Micromonospora fluostatini]|uniref:IS3 family transposase n=1 Tax=Micromonospora sp. JCM 30529 TaxID=3421643 RepID=UPI003D162C84